MRSDARALAARSRQELLRRNAVCAEFFRAEAPRLAAACHAMSHRFLAGGRLLVFGQGAAATDAQHVSVEFIHPIIVGKRALPAIDLGPDFEARLPVLLRPQDMVMGFAFSAPETASDTAASGTARNAASGVVPHAAPNDASHAAPNDAVPRALQRAQEQGALTFALTGAVADYPFAPPDADPFLCQEIVEILYHVLWETVHVYFEHREQGHDVGSAAFLYPFLGKQAQPLEYVIAEVQNSMLQKAEEGNRIRTVMAEAESEAIAEAAEAICARLERGGKLITFGNGGSATDANDLMIDCVTPPPGFTPLPALSLAAEPANITAIANDVGSEAIFTRQLIAHAQPEDVAVALSTSGGSANILAALAAARQRGLLTVGIAGYAGGKMVSDCLVDHALIVRSDYIPRIQEVQASAYHVLRRRVEEVRRGD